MEKCPICGGNVPVNDGPGPSRKYCSIACRKVFHSRKWRARHPNRYDRTQLKRYGISLETYNKMLLDQGGVCAICGEACAAHRRLSVDHCHKTTVVRGLLCRKCNLGIGFFSDNPMLLQTAVNYLSKST